ncbi:OmpA family protein [Aquabacterium sp.]|uniref:OmpA family protein n=1 Tax=Aquabacterium sp. TaxID=1872578 RepID=UPI002BE9BC00|nr:OmpA family protein [Aquabacterium sp.]HSW04582.1 OmpA family protein [Aquabacterium sp.]
MKPTLVASTLAAGLLLGACASTPMPPPELVEARAAVRTAETDANVLAKAPMELKKATDSLNRANLLHAKGESLAEVSSAAHIAQQQARTAMAVAQSKASEDAIRGAEADRERTRADVRSAQAQRARVEANLAQQQAMNAEQRAAGAEQRAAGAEQRASGAEQQAASAQAQANEAQMQAAVLQQRLAELQAKQTERGVLVTLGDVLFEFNRAEVKSTAAASLTKLADFLKQYPGRRVLIEGHTDNIGSDAYNENLSRRRAEAVARQLEMMGVQAPRVTVVGYGKSYPVADNSTDTNRALNRRVEVYLSDNEQPVRMRG